jgi:hypothetical protein
MINTTPMNPARSNKWKFMVIATSIARRSESRVPGAHYNLCEWFEYSASGVCLSDTRQEIMIRLGKSIS